MMTTFFILNEDNLHINESNLHVNVLNESDITTIQDETELRKVTQIHEEDFLIVKFDRTLRFISEHMLEKHKFEENELKDLNILTFVHPKDLPSLANSLMLYHKDKKAKSNVGPVRIKTKSGNYIPYMINLDPIKDDNDEIVETVVILKDVSVPVGEKSKNENVLGGKFHQYGS
jgi:PAS domain S-box-containing protein